MRPTVPTSPLVNRVSFLPNRYDITARTLKTKSPSFDDLNGLVAQVMCGTSTSLRFPGQLNGDLRKLSLNLIPFPRLHFLCPSYAPFHTAGAQAYARVSVQEITQAYVLCSFDAYIPTNCVCLYRLFDRRNLLVAADPRYGFVSLLCGLDR